MKIPLEQGGMFKVPLIGGPHDGAEVEIEVFVIGAGWPWIDQDFAVAIPVENTTPMLIAEYRWLFGMGDHLDFAGYLK